LYLQRHALGNGTMPDAVRAIAEALLTRGVKVSRVLRIATSQS
jgi:hypothetical protein